MYKRGKARPFDDSMLRLGTSNASCLMSPPASPSTARGSPLNTETDTGTSLSFSSRRVAVTTTSDRLSEAPASLLAPYAP